MSGTDLIQPADGMTGDPIADFIKASSAPLDSWHATGTLEQAEAILAAHPEIAHHDIYTAAVLGDDAAVRRFLEQDSTNATAKGGTHGWDALTYLCFSRYLRLDRTRSDGFVRAAQSLLDAGADANTGWFEKNHQPQPAFESALYGACGVAHHAGLTRLLLKHGADPNDGEVTYHTPETHDNDAMKALVETGKLTADSLATLLLRKHDWHDYDGVRFLLEHGADPNRMTHWGITPLHQAARRDNHLAFFELLFDYGADPLIQTQSTQNGHEPMSAAAIAARRGRSDVLDLLKRHGIADGLSGVDRLIAACAKNDTAALHSIAEQEPELGSEVIAQGGKLLAQFAGVGNTEGVRNLLELGVDVNALYKEGDGYFDIAKDSTALHVAAWRANHKTVKFLIERGATVNALDGAVRTPLALAVRASVDSYWTEKRSPESVEALLHAGATLDGVLYPSGYAEIDELLRRRGK